MRLIQVKCNVILAKNDFHIIMCVLNFCIFYDTLLYDSSNVPINVQSQNYIEINPTC